MRWLMQRRRRPPRRNSLSAEIYSVFIHRSSHVEAHCSGYESSRRRWLDEGAAPWAWQIPRAWKENRMRARHELLANTRDFGSADCYEMRRREIKVGNTLRLNLSRHRASVTCRKCASRGDSRKTKIEFGMDLVSGKLTELVINNKRIWDF